MKILRGLSDGMVMQRGENGCDIRFSAHGKGRVRVSQGEVAPLGDDRFRLTGVPVGGPHRLTLADADGETTLENVYVGDVWLLAGQSNMEGAGLRRARDIAYDSAPRPDVRAYYLGDRWDAARSRLHQQWMNSDADVREKFFAVNDRFLSIYKEFSVDTASGVGPGHFIGVRMRELTGVPQGLVPCAFGGSSLADWSPEDDTPASLYRSMMRRFADAGGHVRGVFWYQGEAEAGTPAGVEHFNGNMRRLVAAIRKDAGDETLPFVQAQLGPCSLPQFSTPEISDCWHRFKELQRTMPDWLPSTATVSTADAALQDQIHIDAASQETLGARMAEEMFRLLTGRGEAQPALSRMEVYPHPVKRNHSVVALSFDHVIGKLTSAGQPRGFSITVGDETPYLYPYRYLSEIRLEGNQVLLSVEDDYVPAERAFVWYGAGFSSACTVTDSANRPLLAFGPVKVL